MGNHNNHNKNNTNIFANPTVMAKEGMKFLKDLAFGKGDKAFAEKAFTKIEFVNALRSEVEKRRTEAWAHYSAMCTAYPSSTDPTIMRLTQSDRRRFDCYNTIAFHLDMIIRSNCVGYEDVLTVLQTKLSDYKYNI